MAETNVGEFHRSVSIVCAGGNFLTILIGHSEGELAILQIATGQYLGGIGGKLDVIARRCRVGVYKLCTANIFVVQLINRGASFKLAITVIGDGERDLVFTGIVGDAAEVVVSHLTDDVGLFAYSIKRKGQECNRAVCGVLGGTYNSPAACITQFEREFVFLQFTRADFNVQRLMSGQSNVNAGGRIGVGKGCGCSVNRLVFVSAIPAYIVLSIANQFAIAIILDRYHDLINGGVVFDARNVTGVLADEVNVLICGVEYQRIISAEGGGLIFLVDGSDTVARSRHGGIAHTAQGEGEGIRIVPVAAVQHLCHLEQVFGVGRERMCIVGVYKLGFVVFGVGAAVSNRGFQLVAFGIQRNRDGGGDSLGIGHTIGGGTRLRDGIVVNTRLCVGDCTEIGGLIAFGCRCGFAALISGHRGTDFCRKFKGERIFTIPVTAGNALAYAQLSRGCTCKFVGEGQFVGVYGFPLAFRCVPPIVGGRDFQQFTCCCVCCVGRNLNLNQILLCAVINIGLMLIHFGKLVIIDLTTVFAQRVGNRCKGNLTVLIVGGACRVDRHGGVVARQWRVLLVHRCRFELEVELTFSQLHPIAILVLVDFRCLNVKFLFFICKDVCKLGNCRICGGVITEYLLNSRLIHHQLASAIVHDGNGHMVEGAVIRNAGDFVSGDNLGDVVLISAGFREGDTSEVKVDSRSVGASLTRHRVLSIAYAIRFSSFFGQRGASDSLQLEGKGIAVPPIAALQNLFSRERIIVGIRVYRNSLWFIGVGHCDFLGCTCRDLARAVIGNARLAVACGQILFRDGIGAAYGQAHNLGSLAVFQGESIVVLDGTSGCLSAISIGNGVVIRGIGVHARARQRKLHRKVGVCIRVQAFVGFNHLGNLHAAGGVHGQLTVVAKVQHTHVCGKVPLEVNAAFGGAGFVAALFLILIAQLAINGGGQAAFFDVLFDVAIAIIFFSNATNDFFLSCNANGHIVGLGNRFCMIAFGGKMQVVQLIVIGLVRQYLFGRLILSAFAFTCFGIQQGILGMIVEAIACCRGKGSRGLADGFAICRC